MKIRLMIKALRIKSDITRLVMSEDSLDARLIFDEEDSDAIRYNCGLRRPRQDAGSR